MSKKKIFFVAAIAIVICLLTLCIFARSRSVSSQSPARARETIQEFLGTQVEARTDIKIYSADSVVKWEAPTTEKDKLYIRWTVEDRVKSSLKILFLYENDSKVLMATKSERDFVNEQNQLDLEYKNKKYHNEQNCLDDAFAWEYGGFANCVLTEKQGFNCSSIWTFNESTKTITLVWFDNQTDAWKNYSS